MQSMKITNKRLGPLILRIKTKGSENPIEQLSRVVTDLAAQVKRLQTPSHSSGIYQKSYQHKSSYRDNRDRRDKRHSDKRHHKVQQGP